MDGADAQADEEDGEQEGQEDCEEQVDSEEHVRLSAYGSRHPQAYLIKLFDWLDLQLPLAPPGLLTGRWPPCCALVAAAGTVSLWQATGRSSWRERPAGQAATAHCSD
jgi:hypothetical protein